MFFFILFFFFKQKTAYEMFGSDWSSDVCSSDLDEARHAVNAQSMRAQIVRVYAVGFRSEERRVGKECYQPCRSRWSPYPLKKKKKYCDCGVCFRLKLLCLRL